MKNQMILNIKNFGPINEANININKINLIGGVNASGKSFSSKLLFCFLTAISNQGKRIANNSIKQLFNNFINRWCGNFSFNSASSVEYNSFELKNRLNNILKHWDNNQIDYDFFNNIYLKFEECLDNFKLLDDESCVHDFEMIEKAINEYKTPFSYIEKVVHGLLSNEFANYQLNFFNDADINFKGYGNNFLFEFNVNFNTTEFRVKNNGEDIADFNFNRVLYIDSPAILNYQLKYEDGVFINVDNNPYHFDSLFENLIHKKTRKDIIENINCPYDNFLSEINGIINGSFEFDEENFKFIFNSDKKYEMCDVASGYKQIGIIELLLENQQLSEGALLIIDEPEVNLHPSLQIKLAELLVKISKELNVILYINSHSPFFIEAMEVYSEREGFTDYTNFYLTEEIESQFIIKKISHDDLYLIYDNLTNPFDIINDIRFENDLNK